MAAETSPASSSPSSCVSFSSFDEVPAVPTPPGSPTSTTKLVCSYGGKIMPRRHDGMLRYVGGHTRVLTVQRTLRFHGLYRKLQELCGWDAVTVRCQLPTEDMDALVSVTGDDDLDGVLDEYAAAAARQGTQQLRVRVFLLRLAPSGARTPRSPLRPPLMASRRHRPVHLMYAAYRGVPPRVGRFVVVSPLAARSAVARAEQGSAANANEPRRVPSFVAHDWRASAGFSTCR